MFGESDGVEEGLRDLDGDGRNGASLVGSNSTVSIVKAIQRKVA